MDSLKNSVRQSPRPPRPGYPKLSSFRSSLIFIASSVIDQGRIVPYPATWLPLRHQYKETGLADLQIHRFLIDHEGCHSLFGFLAFSMVSTPLECAIVSNRISSASRIRENPRHIHGYACGFGEPLCIGSQHISSQKIA